MPGKVKSGAKRPNVIPFGKYKGRPVEALAQDREYSDWLTGQAWFREPLRELLHAHRQQFRGSIGDAGA